MLNVWCWLKAPLDHSSFLIGWIRSTQTIMSCIRSFILPHTPKFKGHAMTSYCTTHCSWVPPSLIPRIPRSGMWTLRLCRPSIFSHMSTIKGREGGRKTLITSGCTWGLRTGKRAKVARNFHMYLAIGGKYRTHWALNAELVKQHAFLF